jgi:hypothetical protein
MRLCNGLLGWLPITVVLVSSALGCMMPRDSLTPAQAQAALVAPAAGAVVVVLQSTDGRYGGDVIDEASHCIAFVRGHSTYTARLSPGRHDILLLGGPGRASGVGIDAAAGKTYFLEVREDTLNSGGEPALVPIKPGTADWMDLDRRLGATKSYAVDPLGCATYLSVQRPGWEELIAKTKATVAGLPPDLTADDGVVWRGNASNSTAR